MPENEKVEIEDGIATVSDDIVIGYVTRMSPRVTYTLVTKWRLADGKEPEFLSVTLDGTNISLDFKLPTVTGPISTHNISAKMRSDEYNRGRLARSRHLRLLKEHLGLLRPKEHAKKEMIYLTGHGIWFNAKVVEVELNADGTVRKREGCYERDPYYAENDEKLLARIKDIVARKDALAQEMTEVRKHFKPGRDFRISRK